MLLLAETRVIVAQSKEEVMTLKVERYRRTRGEAVRPEFGSKLLVQP